MRAISIGKFEEGIINEDAAIARKEVIAISDGAGGGGVFADCWSKYLVEHLPNQPIMSYEIFDKWIDEIWEPFYNEYEIKAKDIGGLLLNKFYDEGSFATLAAVWDNGQWISYGDSVVFCYNRKSGILLHSFTKLSDFNAPPYLINCKEPLSEAGFRHGKFAIEKDSIVLIASDTLAHYILMMYELSKKDIFLEEICEAIDMQTKNSNFIMTAMSLGIIDFNVDVISKILHCTSRPFFEKHIKSIINKGLIGHDDYSFAIL